jgi:3-O-alpha-D-mannopyranosyl-alpha-D-mannopyranose xylosylphosphotransferase
LTLCFSPFKGCEHEWNSLLRSSWLLSQRFPNKKRGYLQHIAKTLSQPLLLEARLIWEFQAVPSGTRRFRETSEGKLGDLNTAWLGSWLLVERARESLLWVWAVARLGGVDGLWGEEQRKEVREVLGMKDEDEGKNIKITKIKRDTVKTETIGRAFQGLGEDGPRATKYLWCELCPCLVF